MEKLPTHVAIILDGNRRWAKERGLPSIQGHMAGAKNIKKLALKIFSRGIKYLSIFAFSTENFKRSTEEVDYLMNLFIKEFKKGCKDLIKNNVKIVFSGKKEPLRDEVWNAMQEITQITQSNTGPILNICLNYGGRNEIIETTKKIATWVKEEKISIDEINEEYFRQNLFQNLPDIDLMIRTSGECRISNFMLYQLSYAEMFFTDTYFPAFTIREFDKILNNYMHRSRRFGGNKWKLGL